MDQLPLENFESRVRVFGFVKTLLLALIVKSWLLVGRSVDYGKKGGVFEILNQFLPERLSLCLNMCV
jgi:hypothetical protein